MSDPLRTRGYLHFDEPLPRSALETLVSAPHRVASWQFMPLLRTIVKSKRIKRKNKKTKEFEVKIKERPICYAAHRDAALYAFYARKLSFLYEGVLAADSLSDNVTAFRSATGKCNIHFASEAFEWIGEHKPCVALAYDICSFFDTLDHAVLKQKWCEVLGASSLGPDHYAIFRSLTRYAFVERDRVYKDFSISKYNPRANGRKRICSSEEFRNKVVASGYLDCNKNKIGIPQGTPISAVLSNIYMLDFDREIANIVEGYGGLYRRYCDDVLCVVPVEKVIDAKAAVESAVKRVKLEVQQEKLDERIFGVDDAEVKPLQYLGLTYDGSRVLLRPGGVARYYSKMRGGVRAIVAARGAVARKTGVEVSDVPIRRKRIYRLYSYAGKRNFITYAHRAAVITGFEEMKGQVVRHWSKLRDALRNSE